MTTALSTVEEALDALRRGLPVLVTDDEDRENEGDVILAAQTATDQWLAWTIRWSSGVVCAPMPDEAADRARTVNLLADPATEASDLVRPGHVFPLRAREGGVLVRAGHTEAAVDLCRLAGLSPVGVIAELVHDDGAMMRLPAVLELGAK